MSAFKVSTLANIFADAIVDDEGDRLERRANRDHLVALVTDRRRRVVGLFALLVALRKEWR